MLYVHAVIVLSLIEYMVFGGIVGHARGKHGVKAPDVLGPDDFNRKFRVHQNTLEGLIVFIPAIYLFGTYVSSTVAATIGLIAVIGRALYARGYIIDPDKRGPGAAICGFANIILVLGSAYGVIRAAI